MTTMLGLSRPRLSDDEQRRADKDAAFRTSVETCRRRLESIERVADAVPEDVQLLVSRLYEESLRGLATVHDLPGAEDPGAHATEIIAGVPGREMREQLERAATVVGGEALDADQFVTLRRLVEQLDRTARALHRGDLSTPLVAFQKRVRLAILGGAIAIVAILASVFSGEEASSDATLAFDQIFFSAIALIDSKGYAEAVPLFQQAVALLPDHPLVADAYNNMAWCLFNLERYDEAIAACEMTLELVPGHTLARNNLDAARRQKEIQDAGG
jgi:tetratricopeptide (TPR) repeat protein